MSTFHSSSNNPSFSNPGVRPAPQGPHTVVVTASTGTKDAPGTVPVPMPSYQPPKQAPKEYALTFRDAYTGRSVSGRATADTPLYEIIDYLEQQNILSFPARYISIPGVASLERQGAHFPDVSDIQGVYSGMTLTLDIRQASDPKLQRYPNLRKAYPLSFYRMKNNVCVEKIDFLCYGYEYPDDIVSRMRGDKKLPYSQETGYKILYWPTTAGVPTIERPLDADPLPLCAFDPEPGRVFILQDYVLPPDPFAGYCMYGCPTAALPEQENILSQRALDILEFD